MLGRRMLVGLGKIILTMERMIVLMEYFVGVAKSLFVLLVLKRGFIVVYAFIKPSAGSTRISRVGPWRAWSCPRGSADERPAVRALAAVEPRSRRLRRDLLAEGGPAIEHHAQLPLRHPALRPEDEFGSARRSPLGDELRANGWVVLSISPRRLLLDRIRGVRATGGASGIIAPGARPAAPAAPAAASTTCGTRLAAHIEGPDGIAADVARLDRRLRRAPPRQAPSAPSSSSAAPARSTPSSARRRCSSTSTAAPATCRWSCSIPASAAGRPALSFMGELNPDSDYRPRIYP